MNIKVISKSQDNRRAQVILNGATKHLVKQNGVWTAKEYLGARKYDETDKFRYIPYPEISI